MLWIKISGECAVVICIRRKHEDDMMWWMKHDDDEVWTHDTKCVNENSQVV